MSGSATRQPAMPEKQSPAFLTDTQKRLLWAVGGISIFTNLLMLTGPIFMLQVYERVLSSRSEATLVALMALVGFLYLILGLLDHARARIAARVGAQVQQTLDLPVFATALAGNTAQQGATGAARAPQDLSLLQQISGAPVAMALFDLPWVPLFLIVIAVLHPVLGVVALAAALGLAGLGVSAITLSRSRSEASLLATHRSELLARRIASTARPLQALGMQGHILKHWQALRESAVHKALVAQDHSGRFGAGGRALRLFLQSAILGAGAWLVLRSELSPGAMIAASIILGRALAPLDQVISGWPQLQAAHGAIRRLRSLLARVPPARNLTTLPPPRGKLSIRELAVRTQDTDRDGTRFLLQPISFELMQGQALGVIGPSGAGKSTLLDTIAGAMPTASGTMHLGTTRLGFSQRPYLQHAIGYLPQTVALYEGSIRDNIARLDPDAADPAVIAAAKLAGAHDLILSLPDEYDTLIRADGGGLSGGQMQQICLARALYGDPALLLLDEPNANLDDMGERVLHAAIHAAKMRGAVVLIAAHRPSAIAQCDLLLKLDHGRMSAFGPREEVLRAVTRNSGDILHPLPLHPRATGRSYRAPDMPVMRQGREPLS